MLRRAVAAVGAEVAEAEELEVAEGLGIGQQLFNLAAGEDLEGIGIEAVDEVLIRAVGVLVRKKIAV